MEDVIHGSIRMLVALTSKSPRPFETNAATIRPPIGQQRHRRSLLRTWYLLMQSDVNYFLLALLDKHSTGTSTSTILG